MLILSIASFVVGGGVAGWAAWQHLPRLADTREGRMAFWIVCALVAAGAGLAALHLYVGIHEVTASASTQISLSERAADAFNEVIPHIFYESGVLLGLAAVTYLLAPAGED